MSLKANIYRREQGAIIGFSIVLCLTIVMLGYAFFHISMLLGGSIEFRNAVDAGALSVARDTLNAPQINIAMAAQRGGASPETAREIARQLEPLCQKESRVTLSTLNRLSAASLMVEMNEYAMQKEGTSTGIIGSTRNARQFDQTMAEIAKELAQRYEQREQRFQPFLRVSSANRINMLGAGSTPLPELKGWESSYLNRRTATNVYLDRRQVPEGYDKEKIPTTSIQLKGAPRNYICGYEPIEADSPTFVRPRSRSYFVPLRPGLKPHLVHKREFESGQVPPVRLDAKYLVPNGISASARSRVQQRQFLEYTSFTAAEGQDEGYAAELPAAYIRIENSSDSTRPVQLSEYVVDKDFKEINDRLKQRIWQIDPGYDPGQMQAMFGQTIQPGRKLIITSGRQSERPGLTERNSKPDGNSSLTPVTTRDGTIFQWIPSTGSNGLLGVLQITAKGSTAR